MSEITESEERLARPLIRLAKLVGVGTSYLGMSHDYHEIDDDVLIEVLAALGIANMWLAVFGDVGVAIIAILNAMRAMGVKNL